MKYCIALIYLILTVLSHAGSGGPDAHGYTWFDQDDVNSGATNEIINHTAEATLVLANDAADSSVQMLEVPWGGIYGQQCTSLRVSRDGFLSFSTANDPTPDCPLPAVPTGSPAGGHARIYVHHQDLTGGTVYYERFEERVHSQSNCGAHVFTWSGVQQATGDQTPFTVQVLLFDDFDILIQYGAMPSANTFTVGIQNADASIGLGVHCGAGSTPPKSNATILIRPPVLTVNTTANQLDTPSGGQLSMREAVRDAVSGSRIEFDGSLFTSSQTLELSGATNIEIDGKTIAMGRCVKGAYNFDGGRARRHFTVENDGYLALFGFRLFDGGGASSSSGSVLVDDGATLFAAACSWEGNRGGANGYGGAINADESASVYLRGCNFFNNRSQRSGGAIVAEGAVVDAWRCRFWKNSAVQGGGALATYEVLSNVRSTFELRECDFALNEAGGGGGAINLNNANANIRSCTFDDNRAALTGGAVLATGGVAGLPSATAFSRCIFYGNRAEAGGGALRYMGDELGATFAVGGSTIYRNDGGNVAGALLLGDGDVGMNSTIVADNVAGSAEDQFANSPGTTGGLINITSNVETGSEGGFAVSNVSDIRLTALGYFGGFVRTCVPLEGSPAIGAGSQFSPDARGVPISFPSEAGAVELAPVHTVTSSTPTGAGSIQAALDAVGSTGGVVRFDGVDKIDVTDLDLPAAPVMIEGPVILNGLGLSSNVTAPLAFYSCRLRGVGQAKAMRAQAPVTFDRCELSGYGSASGFSVIDGKLISVASSKFSGNIGGSQISAFGGEGVFIRDTQLSHNRAHVGTRAGGIRADSCFLVVQRSSITENRFSQSFVPAAEAIWLRASSGPVGEATLHLENSTISENWAGEAVTPRLSGVVFFLTGGNSRMVGEIRHCTIAGNTAVGGLGRGIYAYSNHVSEVPDVTVTNSIVANHDTNFDIVGDDFSGGGNLSDSAIPGALASDIENTDPLLSALVLGRNRTLHSYPRIGSAAINAALDTVPAASRDGRGGHRKINANNGVVGSFPDVGAVETGARIFVTTAIDENDGGLGQGAGNSLREVLTLADNIGGANIGFAPALHGSVIPVSATIDLDEGIIDVDALGTGIVLENTGSFYAFGIFGKSALSIHGASFDSSEGVLFSTDRSAGTLQGCDLYDGENWAVYTAGLSSVRIAESSLREISGSSKSVVMIAGSSLSFVRSTFSEISSNLSVIDTNGTSKFEAIDSTFARNTAAYCIDTSDETEVWLDGCTFSRNRKVGSFSGGDVFLLDNVFHNNGDVPILGTPTLFTSYGGNRASITNARLNHPDDCDEVPIFLSPLADYDGNGVPEMPAQWVDRGLFVGNPFLKATNNSDANYFTFISLPDKSLRQAIHFAEDGDVVTFDPSLNGATIPIQFSDLVIDRSITIDASALPDGITLEGIRSIDPTGDVTVCFINVQFQNRNNGATLGGGVRGVSGANLVFDRCTFTNCSASFGGAIAVNNGSVFAQNCTFYDNTASSRGGAVFLQNSAQGRFEYCTFDQNDAGIDGGAISGNGTSSVEVFGCAFGSNMVTSTSKLGNIEMVASGSAASLGYNIFSDEPAFAIGSDGVDALPELNPLADNGGGVATQTPDGAGSNVVDFLPFSGTLRPPWVDARGYPRAVVIRADAGAAEWGAEGVDSDNDMMPDWWENFYGLTYLNAGNADDNGDGDDASDLGEFQLGTDPLVADVFTPEGVAVSQVPLPGNNVEFQLDWRGQVGFDYQFQYSTDLETWIDSGLPVTAHGAVQSATVVLPDSNVRLFGRMTVVP